MVSNARDVTADFFEVRLAQARVPYARLNTEELASLPISFRLALGTDAHPASPTGYFTAGGRRIALDEVTAIYYRRPVPPVLPDTTLPGLRGWMESELRRAWGGLLSARPEVRWVNHPLATSAASYKPEQLARAARFGLPVPDTLITTDPAEGEAFCDARGWTVITKPIGHGEILADDEADDRVVYTNRVPPSARTQLHRVADCPTLFQQTIEKDVDLRVTVAGRELVAVALHSQERAISAVDCRRANMAGMRYSRATLPDDVADRLLALTASYGLHYGAVDLVRDREGELWFLELNPAGQWAWLEQVAGAPIAAALIRCLQGAG